MTDFEKIGKNDEPAIKNFTFEIIIGVSFNAKTERAALDELYGQYPDAVVVEVTT